jgi:hypothetical protein
LDQVLGVEISTGAINAIRCRLSASLASLVEEAAEAIRHNKVSHMNETGGPIGNADNIPDRHRPLQQLEACIPSRHRRREQMYGSRCNLHKMICLPSLRGPLYRLSHHRLSWDLSVSHAAPVDHFSDLVILIGAGAPWPELIAQTLQAEIPVTLASLAHGHGRQAHPLGNGRIGFTGSASQQDLHPLHDRMGQRPWGGDSLELLNLVVAENQRRHRANNCHGTALFGE